ncbi:periplasmic protein TonB [Methylococcus capsulatus]|jgi:protein TonB|uniref:Periplasmic protein TonB n=1 Tax=Methylococcus capsulatus TaxID=414 RepID=A0AA35XVG3_METCP|nr:energy transducer TonB [Methylococcus capsulatus]CAI8837117.1 periplasmic protein TonB [Methylococcus capsulatus]
MSLESRDQSRLLLALLIALAVHAAVILGLNVRSAVTTKDLPRVFDVAVLRLPTPEAPKRAEHRAAENQRGDDRPETVEPVPGRGAKKMTEPAQNGASRPVTERPPRLRSNRAEHAVKAAPVVEPELEVSPAVPISAESLSRQIAEFGAAYVRQQQEAPHPRMVYINSVNAHKYKAAAYERAWQDKVERIGNLNYPEEARRKDLTGSLLLSVALRPDGSVYKVQVRRSSGEPALDEAAVRIVHLAAPFAPFPVELREEADMLVITRTWKFLNGTRLETAP